MPLAPLTLVALDLAFAGLLEAPAAGPGATPHTRSADAPAQVEGVAGDQGGAPSGTDASGASPSGDRDGGVFFGEGLVDESAPAATTGPKSAPKTPPMPEVEEIPSKAPTRAGSPPVVFGGAKDRTPVRGGGVDFFDPGRLGDDGPTGGGGSIQIRGYLGLNFMVAERTNTSARDPSTGEFEKLKTLPAFGGGAANLYVGAPIYADVVYARVAFEFLSIPRADIAAADVAPAWTPVVLMESAALEVNPFSWAHKTGRWFREGFKITAGVFIVPFGLEDEEHDAPVRWFVSRPLAMSSGRVYPGSWIDLGATIKWKPTFGKKRPIRPLEIDVGVVNGDACTQTRAIDILYRFQGIGQVDEVCEHRIRGDAVAMIPRADGAIVGITPDNNGNKSFLARVMIRPVPALNLGGSIIWGKHPRSDLSQYDATEFKGKTYIDTEQAPTWRAGAHFDLNFDELIQSPFPLPHVRGEAVYGVDKAAPALNPDKPLYADRRMFGGYIQVAQPLWRRKKTRLPGLIVQYRFDHSDPDLDVPHVTATETSLSDFSDTYKYDEAMRAHVIGLRMPVLPRFALKAEYGFLREDGGRRNQLHNDIFFFQAVADF
ncbi:MAG: hypothetical protein R3B09_03920 [Nannocystaceae bacterium]